MLLAARGQRPTAMVAIGRSAVGDRHQVVRRCAACRESVLCQRLIRHSSFIEDKQPTLAVGRWKENDECRPIVVAGPGACLDGHHAEYSPLRSVSVEAALSAGGSFFALNVTYPFNSLGSQLSGRWLPPGSIHLPWRLFVLASSQSPSGTDPPVRRAQSSLSDDRWEAVPMTNVASKTNVQSRCPKCMSGTVSLRDQRNYYGPEGELAAVRKTLIPIAIDRTYTCNKCGHMEAHRDML